MPLDITPAQLFLESEMSMNSCTVYRDEEQTDDDELDPETGVLVPPADDTSVVVVDADCLFVPKQKVVDETEQGGVGIDIKTYTLWLRLDSEDLQPDDRVVLTEVARLPEWVGRELWVNDEADLTSYPVGKKYEVRTKKARLFPRER